LILLKRLKKTSPSGHFDDKSLDRLAKHEAQYFNTHTAPTNSEEELRQVFLTTLNRSPNSQFQGIKLRDINDLLDHKGVTLLSLKPESS
jgi:hypothetical protein